MAWPWPRTSAPTEARPSSAQRSSGAREAAVGTAAEPVSGRAAAAGASPSAGTGAAGPSGISQRSSWSSATRCASRSSRAGAVTGPAESCRSESTWGTDSTTSATRPGSTPAGARWISDHASNRATQPRRTALSSLSHACSRQPGRTTPSWTSTRPESLARSHAVCAWEAVRSSVVTARSRAFGPRGPAPGSRSAAAQRAIRTASDRTALAWRASSARGGVPSGGRGAWRLRPVVTARRAEASGCDGTSRSLELRANCSSGFRDVTDGSLPAVRPKAQTERVVRAGCRRRGGGSRHFVRCVPAPARGGGARWTEGRESRSGAVYSGRCPGYHLTSAG